MRPSAHASEPQAGSRALAQPPSRALVLGRGLALVLTCALGACAPAEPEPPATLVLVTIDTLRADHLPWHGYPRDTAPHMSALAEGGQVFLAAESSSSHTGPSHATMLTGAYPTQHGLLMNGWSLGEDTESVVEVLASAGWRTGAFVSVGFLEGLSPGFGTFDHKLRHQPTTRQDGALRFRPADDTVTAALEWAADAPDDAPLFLWVHLYDVHGWLRTDRFQEQEAQLRADDHLSREELAAFLTDEQALDPAAYDEGLDGLLAGVDSYDTTIRVVDQAVQRLRAGLEPRGPLVTVLTADHGEGLGAHAFLTHGQYIYSEQLHVPLVLHASDGRLAPGQRGDLVHHVDLAPTLLELASVRAAWRPAEMADPALAGRSLLAPPGSAPRVLLAQRRPADISRLRHNNWFAGEVLSIRSGDFRWIHYDGGEDETFDLRADPRERAPLDEQQRAAARPLFDLLQAQRRRMAEQGAGKAGEFDPAHLEELEALGYTR